MSMISCPDCGRQVSSSAASCLGCGRPIAYQPPMAPPAYYQAPTTIHVSQPVEQGSALLGFLGGFFFGCLGFALIMMLARGSQTKAGAAAGFGCGLLIGLVILGMGGLH